MTVNVACGSQKSGLAPYKRLRPSTGSCSYGVEMPRLSLLLIVLGVLLAGCVSGSVSVFHEDWTTFKSPAGFSVDVPAPLNETVQQLNNPNLGPIETHFLVTTTPYGVRYAVIYADFPARYVNGVSAQQVLAESRAGDEKSLKAQATNLRELTVSGRPAIEYTIQRPTGMSTVRLMLDGRRLYSLSVTGAGAESSDLTRFLDSFMLTGV